MIRKLKGAAVFATMLLFTMGTANAATISINKSITIASANDGPLVFDFGVVSAGVSNVFAGSVLINFVNPGGSKLTFSPPINGFIGSCPFSPPGLGPGGSCVENINFFFAETPSTPDGIYSGHTTQTFSFVTAAGASISDPVEFDWTVNVGNASVPSPVAGAGLPGLIMAGGGILGWRRRKRGARAPDRPAPM